MVSGVNSYSIPPYKTTVEIIQWLSKLDDYIMASHGEDCSELRKLAILRTVMGEETETAVNNFLPEEKDSYKNLKEKLVSYYKPSVNHSTYRHEFYTMYQEQGESIDDFLNRLKDLATKCAFTLNSSSHIIRTL